MAAQIKPILFNPVDVGYKSPVGAVFVNKPLIINIDILRSYAAYEVYFVLNKENEDEIFYAMSRSGSGAYDSYGTARTITSTGLYFYYFVVNTPIGQYRVGCGEGMSAVLGTGGKWQLTVVNPHYKEPEGFEGGLIYQIFVDRFCIGGERKKSDDRNEYRYDWGGIPRFYANSAGEYAVDFFGGNLKGIIQKLSYIKSLGANIIYLNPIFKARSNHKYDTGDYMQIDPDFGTVEDFENLCEEAQKKGIKILLDGVFSHTGSDSLYFNKYAKYQSMGAYQSKHSPYFEWYRFRSFPNSYDCWWNFDTLPNVNELNPSYNQFINGENGVIRTWLRRGAAGWRLDVADELPDEFLDNLTLAAKSEKAGAMVLGEVWEDASTKFAYGQRRRYLKGRQLDSVMNYPFRTAIIDFVKTSNAKALRATVESIQNNYPKYVLDNLMNSLSTHDTARILTLFGAEHIPSNKAERAIYRLADYKQAFKKLKLALVLQYTLSGIPCVFYGDEAGLEGFEDPFCRACYPWGNERKDILAFFKELGKIRLENKKIFAKGELRFFYSDDGVVAYFRQAGADKIAVVINNSQRRFTLEIEGAYKVVSGASHSGKIYAVGSYSYAILKLCDQ